MNTLFFRVAFSLLLCVGCLFCTAQRILSADARQLRKVEDSLKVLSNQIVLGADGAIRFSADQAFTKQLVQALKAKNSFYYSFDSIQTVSRLYAPDSSFRIFTWQYQKDSDYFRQRGAIQMRTNDGSLKLFPLFDYSDFTNHPTDSVRSASQWIGAIYYKIVETKYAGKKYYTLLGFDDNSMNSSKKWMEVLTFANDGTPVFGGRYFDYKDDETKPIQPAYRFCVEYKKESGVRLSYDADMDMIVFDHLASENSDLKKKETLIPDGDYEGFKWSKGKWVHVDDIFGVAPKMATPVPSPIRDITGKPDEQKLQEQSMKNKQKK